MPRSSLRHCRRPSTDTVPKPRRSSSAKELRPLAEKLITLAKNDIVHARRQAARSIPDDALIAKLFDILGPRFSTRPGGYTRILKLGARRGDAAEMAIIELVERSADKIETAEAPAKGAAKKKVEAKPKAEAKPKVEAKKKAEAKKTDAEPADEEKPKRAKKAAPKAKAAPAKEKPKKKAAPSKKKAK